MLKLHFKSILFLLILPFISIAQSNNNRTLFEIKSPENSGIHFMGNFQDSHMIGGGVGIGDINNDGLEDIYFTGDSVNALYLNKGNMFFENITESSGTEGIGLSSGVCIGDINNDGFKDIIISRDNVSQKNIGISVYPSEDLNLIVYINNGNLTFSNKSKQLGILPKQSIQQSVLLDYNKDNLLDIYSAGFIAERSYAMQGTSIKKNENNKYYYDFLFKNEGNGFKNVTKQSGIYFPTKYNFVFSPFASDFNQDGWTDLYLTNDFDTPDYMFINNKGSFKESSKNFLKHCSFFTMALDVADLNNDGFMDIFTTDMRSVKNYKQKTFMAEMPFDWESIFSENGMEKGRQQVKNCMQINGGNNKFSEISDLTGTDATEWSWSTLLADYDNDGFKDIFIANGNSIYYSLELDYPIFYDSLKRVMPKKNIDSLIAKMKLDPIFVNFIFKNNGDLSFTNEQKNWGMGPPVNSDGAAYGDLDNDGDLDLVVNNNKSLSFIYENKQRQISPQAKYLRIELVNQNHYPIQGSTAKLYNKGKLQFLELQPVRGFYSTSEDVFHFGVGEADVIDSVEIKWPDGNINVIKNIKTNQQIKFVYSKSNIVRNEAASPLLFKALPASYGLNYKHEENDFVDFQIDPLLPNMYSRNGPSISCSDINKDGLEDIIIGGSANKHTSCFIQKPDGKFERKNFSFTADTTAEDMGILIFDANSDGYNDVLISAGGYEFLDRSENLKARLYRNNKKGNFILDKSFPDIRTSASCVTAADFDNDGDLDLFIGGRVSSQKYPVIPESYLLQNNSGKFKNITKKLSPEIERVGMISSAIWSDFDNDNWMDLILVGEYMPVTFFKNEKGKLVNYNSKLNFNEKTQGLWNSIEGADIDNDGDIDYVVGNLGLNTRYKASQDGPLELYANDFDENGSVDIITSYYDGGKSYPTKQLKSLAPRINGFSKRFYKVKDYANTEMKDLFPKEKLDKSMHFMAYETASCIIENKGNNNFELRKLPVEAQFSPIYGILADDVDNDGNLDLLLSGNFYSPEVERGRYDALQGLYLKGDGKGAFAALSPGKSGFIIDGDAKALTSIQLADTTYYLGTQNSDSLKVYSYHSIPEKGVKSIAVPPGIHYAFLSLKNGKTRKQEFYFGEGYLSQRSSLLKLNPNISEYKWGQKNTEK